MQNGNSNNSQRPINLSELSFADIARIRREKAQQAETQKKAKESPKPKPQQPEVTQPEDETADETAAEEVIIELRDDIDIASDFCKVPNNRWKIAPLQDPKEYCVYDFLYKMSYGWHRNVCRVGYGAIVKNTSIPSRSTAIKAIKGLLEKVHIIKIEEETQSNDGTLYRVLSPDEILSGVFKMSIVKLSIVKLSISKLSISKLGIVNLNTPYIQNEYSQIEYTGKNKATSGSAGVFKLSIVKLNTNKDSILKRSLKTTTEEKRSKNGESVNAIDISHPDDLVVVVSSSRFLKEVSESVLTKLCEEYGSEKVVEKIYLLDKQYAGKEVKNPGGLLREALREDYTTPTKQEEHKKSETAEEQAKQKAVDEELRRQEEELRQKLLEQKAKMTEKERNALREQALEEIRSMDNIKEEFITEMLIEAKENEILKREM